MLAELIEKGEPFIANAATKEEGVLLFELLKSMGVVWIGDSRTIDPEEDAQRCFNMYGEVSLIVHYCHKKDKIAYGSRKYHKEQEPYSLYEQYNYKELVMPVINIQAFEDFLIS